MSDLAHDVRNHVAVILGYLEMLARDPVTASEHEAVEHIRQAASAILKLVDDNLNPMNAPG